MGMISEPPDVIISSIHIYPGLENVFKFHRNFQVFQFLCCIRIDGKMVLQWMLHMITNDFSEVSQGK